MLPRSEKGLATLTERVYALIKNDIINGVFPPGMHLVRRTLAKRYGVSPLPIMEACFRLENDGLVENSPMLGTHVIEINAEIIEEDRKYREALECQSARLFVENAPLLERQQLLVLAAFLDSIHKKLKAGEKEMEESFRQHHLEFHLAVARGSGAKVIHRQMKKLWYRRVMVAGDTHATLFPAPPGWHTTLAECLGGGDPDKADKCMRFHLRYNNDREKTRDSVCEVLRRGDKELIDRILEQQVVSDDEYLP